MSDWDESGVTYTYISSPFEELSDIGSPRADDHEHLMLPEMLEDPYIEVALQAPPSPDYIPGPEEPEQAPPSPDYISESDFEAHPKGDDDEDHEEDPVDYLADGGDDGDDEEGLLEDDEEDEDDDMDIEAGSLPGKPMQIISALQACTLLYHGCEGCLAMIHDMTSEIPTIHDQPIVSEFPDVFPDELPGIPPVREVEFNIELTPGAEPISKATYRMAPGAMHFSKIDYG
nr:putative reverse transcriptase domain-containing protein [Tanacetum cinerariifolium]